MSTTLTADERLARIEAAMNKPNRPAVEPLSADDLTPTQSDAQLQKTFGFKSFGHFLADVYDTRQKNGGVATGQLARVVKSEVFKKAATGMGELVGSDGGFLVPPQFSDKIFERVYREDTLMNRTDSYTCTGNSMVFPRNAETSRATGSRYGGVRAYWVQEGSTITTSAPTFGRLQLQLNKLACLCRVTEELIQDSGTVLESYLTKVFSAEIAFTAGNAVYRGTGAGQPQGLLNAACTVSVSKETGQAAATIVSENIVKMWARRYALGPTGQYAWLINQDVGPQLYLMTLPVGTGGVVTYMPPGGLSDKPYATLMGAPVIEIEYASTLGTVGDIALVDLGQYVTISKGGLNASSSMHVYFATDEQAFKTTFRVDGAPWQSAALTPFQGSNTQSPFITLATRS